mgnify:FL=1
MTVRATVVAHTFPKIYAPFIVQGCQEQGSLGFRGNDETPQNRRNGGQVGV